MTGGREVTLWDMWELWRRIEPIELLTTLSDGRWLTSAPDGTVVIRDEEGKEVGPVFEGHQASVTTIDVAGNVVATASDDGTARLWHLDTGRQIGRPIWASGGVVDLSDDGRRLAVVNDGAVSILSLDPDDWAGAACRLAGRNLTREEWARYLPPGEPYRATCPQWPTDPDVHVVSDTT